MASRNVSRLAEKRGRARRRLSQREKLRHGRARSRDAHSPALDHTIETPCRSPRSLLNRSGQKICPPLRVGGVVLPHVLDHYQPSACRGRRECGKRPSVPWSIGGEQKRATPFFQTTRSGRCEHRERAKHTARPCRLCLPFRSLLHGRHTKGSLPSSAPALIVVSITEAKARALMTPRVLVLAVSSRRSRLACEGSWCRRASGAAFPDAQAHAGCATLRHRASFGTRKRTPWAAHLRRRSKAAAA